MLRPITCTSSCRAALAIISGVWKRPVYTTSNPASRSARTSTFAPRSCPSRPGLAIKTRMGVSTRVERLESVTVTPTPPVCVSVWVETLAGLPAKLAGRDHAAQQRCGTVFVVAKVTLQGFHDGKTDIETYQVRQSQWTHWVCRAKSHDRIDGFSVGDAVLKREDRLVDHRQQDAVGNKSWRVIYDHRRFPESACIFMCRLQRLFGSVKPADDLY